MTNAEVPNTNVGDMIYRQAAIDVLNIGAELLRRVLDEADIVGAEREKYEWGLGLIESYISDMKELPSAHEENSEDTRAAYEQGRIQGHVEMRTELLMSLKEIVGDEVWKNI